MAKIDVTKIEGYADMTPEEKLKALEGYDVPDPDYSGYVKKDVFDKTASELAAKKKELNGKLTAAMLKATAQKHDDERQYVYPDNLRREYIPQEVFDFFDRMYDPNISDAEYFKSKLEISVGECPVTIGFGGIHGAIPNYFWSEQEDPEEAIRNKDVGSYYPHLCTINGYTSRNIPSPQVYENVLESRMKAKAAGDIATANALKLVCNTTYGCLLNQYNDLYDPLMGRSVCISGQLYLLELARHCYQDIPGLKIVQLNTDGIMWYFKIK